jgi:hypothetical protein
MSLYRLPACAWVAAVLVSFALGGCGSSPEPEAPPPPPPQYVSPPPPPLDDLLREARDAEKVGTEIQNFNCLLGLEEAVRANQRIVDHYARSDEAKGAREKVKELGEKVRTLRAWKKRLDAAAAQAKTVSAHPAGAHATHEALTKMLSEVPEGFVRETTQKVLETFSGAYREGALRETESVAKKADAFVEKGDFRGALSLFAKLPPEFGADLPDVGQAIRDARTRLEGKVAEKGRAEIERAQRALQKKQEREAGSILKAAWEKFRGYPVSDEILKLERETFRVRLKVATAEAAGTVRKTDLELFRALESGAEILPAQPEFRSRMADQLKAYREFLSRYLAGVDLLWCTRKEYDVRKALLDSWIAREEQVLQAGR